MRHAPQTSAADVERPTWRHERCDGAAAGAEHAEQRDDVDAGAELEDVRAEQRDQGRDRSDDHPDPPCGCGGADLRSFVHCHLDFGRATR